MESGNWEFGKNVLLTHRKNRRNDMTVDVVSEIVRAGLYTIIKTSAPVLLLSLIVGLIVSIFQTATSIQEQTLTFVPKIVAVFLGIMLFGGWMLNEMVSYMVNLWSDFTLYIK